MMKMKNLLMALVLLPLMALADTVTLKNIGVADANAPVELGQWHGGFEKCLEKADREHIPMLAIWGNASGGCGSCNRLTAALTNEYFLAWRNSSGGKIILLYMEGWEFEGRVWGMDIFEDVMVISGRAEV